MSKTAVDYLDHINFEDRATDCQYGDGSRDYDKAISLKSDIAQAMQSYAQQQSEGFAEWIDKNCEKSSYKPYSRWYRPTAAYYTTSELYQLFTQQNQK